MGSVDGTVKVGLSAPDQISITSTMEQTLDGVNTKYDFAKTFGLAKTIDTQSMTTNLCDDGIMIVEGETISNEQYDDDDEDADIAAYELPNYPFADFENEDSTTFDDEMADDFEGRMNRRRRLYDYDVVLDINSCGSFNSVDKSGELSQNMLRSFTSVLSKFNIDASTDVFSQYRSFRYTNNSSETQAYSIIQRGNKYQVSNIITIIIQI